MTAKEFTVSQAYTLLGGGLAQLVDLREPPEFAKGHPAGALNVPFSERSLAERIGRVVRPGASVIFLDTDGSRLGRAARQLEEASKPSLNGVVRGGWGAWQEARLPAQRMDEVSVRDLPQRLASDPGLVVVDVREPMEWEMGHVPGAMLISLGELRERLAELDRTKTTLVICEAGVRSSTGASLLQAAGFAKVANVVEGTGGYRSAGLPLQFPAT